MKKLTIFLATVFFTLSIVGSSNAMLVDLELSLLLDVSGSVNSTEFNLQKKGYVDAFNNANIWTAISQGTLGSIAVNLVYWSGVGQQSEAVVWTEIDSQADAFAFASAIDATSRPFFGLTGIQDALKFGADSVAGNNFDGTRKVIDVSGDGENYPGLAGTQDPGRTYALNHDIDTINGIVIGGDSSVFDYYNDQVVGGTNAFSMQVNSFGQFGVAIDRKLIREISNEVPEPSTLLLMGAGLFGLVSYGRKRSSKQK